MAHTEPTVQDWQREIKRAKNYQAQTAGVSSWETARGYYMNKYPDDVISVNLVFAIGRALVPQLYFKVPTVLVQPDKKEFEEFAPVVEAVDKKLIVQMGMKQQLKLGILDAYVSNIAVFKFGYHSVATEFPRPAQPSGNENIESETLEALRRIEGGEELAVRSEQTRKEIRTYSYHDWIKPNSPWMLRVRPEDLLVPWGAQDIYSIPWCAFRVVRLLEDVKNDPVYDKAVTADLKANTTLSTPLDKEEATTPTTHKGGIPGVPTAKRPNAADTELDALEFYEIWDKRSGKVLAVLEDTQKEQFMRNDVHGLDIQGLPVEMLQFNPTGWNFWGPTDVDQITQQQIEYNETRTLEIMHKRAAVLKFLVDQGAMDDTEIAKLTEGKIIVAKTKLPPNAAIKELNPNMSRDIFNVSDVIRTDISEILGFSRNQAGEFDVSRRTATEASIVQRALEIRSDERRDQVADLIAAAFQRKINPMIFDQWTEQRSIEVSGKGGWVKFNGRQIRGDYSVSIVADSVVPLTQAQRQQTALTALQQFKDDPRIDQNRLYEWALGQFQALGLPTDLLLSDEEFQKNQQQQLIQGLLQEVGKAQAKQATKPQQPGGGTGGNGQTRPRVSPVQR